MKRLFHEKAPCLILLVYGCSQPEQDFDHFGMFFLVLDGVKQWGNFVIVLDVEVSPPAMDQDDTCASMSHIGGQVKWGVPILCEG